MRYLVIDERKDSNEFTEEFATKEEAIREAAAAFSRMSRADKEDCVRFYVLESVNPDEDAADHFDGADVATFKAEDESYNRLMADPDRTLVLMDEELLAEVKEGLSTDCTAELMTAYCAAHWEEFGEAFTLGDRVEDENSIFSFMRRAKVQNDMTNVFVSLDGAEAAISIDSVMDGEEESEPFEASYILEEDHTHPAWEELYAHWRKARLRKER